MASEWKIEKTSDHQVKVTLPDTISVTKNTLTVEELLLALSQELVTRVTKTNAECIVQRGLECGIQSGAV
jgi:hypothetical protein